MNFILDNASKENQIIDCLNEYGICLVKDFFSEKEVNKLFDELDVMYNMITEGCHGYFYSPNNVELSSDKDYLSGKAMRIFPQYYENISQLLDMFVRNGLLNNILNRHFSPNCQKFLQVFSTRETKIVDDKNLPRNSHMHIDPYESLKFATFFQKTTKENGALRVIPGSFKEGSFIRKEFIFNNKGKGQYGGDPHRMDEFPEDMVTFYQNESLYIDCDIGDLVILNTDNYHSGGTLLENSSRQALYVHNRP